MCALSVGRECGGGCEAPGEAHPSSDGTWRGGEHHQGTSLLTEDEANSEKTAVRAGGGPLLRPSSRPAAGERGAARAHGRLVPRRQAAARPARPRALESTAHAGPRRARGTARSAPPCTPTHTRVHSHVHIHKRGLTVDTPTCTHGSSRAITAFPALNWK